MKTNKKSRSRSQQIQWSVSNLEPRLMLAGDAGAEVCEAVSVETGVSGDTASEASAAIEQTAAATDIVFIDSGVDDLGTLLAEAPGDAEVVLLSSDKPGLQQIDQVLRSRVNVRSVHIVSHGQSGTIQLGDQKVDEAVLVANQNMLKNWAGSLHANADILLYGCSSGEGASGDGFVRRLAELTGADVAASTDVTGHASKQADWELERRVGDIESSVVFSKNIRDRYQGVLQISIYAAGSMGDEQMELQIDGQTVATYNHVGGDPGERQFNRFDYDATGINVGQIRVLFTNDQYDPNMGVDRNLIVDRIEIDGVSHQSESPSTLSTGTWIGGDLIEPGNHRSEVLHANGYFQYSDEPTVVTLDIHASGSEGGEQFEVLVDGQVVGRFSANTEVEQFSIQLERDINPSSVRVQFTNDQYDPDNGFDRNLIVDKIAINGTDYETESSGVFSTGTWSQDAIVPGFRSSEALHTNGYFQFGLQSVAEVMSIDGSGNNVDNPEWGATMERFIRTADSAYGDGLNTPSLGDNPNARDVSNLISDQNASVENDRFLTSIWFQWGQFLDHDITRAFTLDRSAPSEPFEIADGFGFTRSVYDTDTGIDSPREQFNHITAYIDGSVVYGSDEARSRELRTLSGGRLDSIFTDAGELLPLNTAGLENAAPPSAEFFVAGDVRVNENIALTAMQTLFVREHNRVAAEIAVNEFGSADLNDAAVDEEIFQRARQYVAGLIQNITYNEFLPSTLGFNAISTYQGYDSSINAQISNTFTTAAYRMGHTTLPNELLIGSDGSSVSLAEAFSRPDFVKQTGIEAIFEGLTLQRMQEVDALVVDGVRNALQDGSGGLDLVARNIQRGRDHGLPDFNSVRIAIGLDRIDSFYELTSDVELADKLTELYGSPDHADPWIAMIAEDQLPGASVGETINAYMVDQFTRLRDGDRFYFENVFDAETAGEIKATRLSDVIKRNTTGLENIQAEVFWTRDTLVFRNGLDNEWLIRDFGDNGGAEVVFFGEQGERDPSDRNETIPVQRDEPINAVVVAGINEQGDGFFIPNALVPTPKADLGIDEFIVTADIEFFEAYGLGGDDRWVIESDVASLFASGDDGNDVLAVANDLHDAEISLTGGDGSDKIRVAALNAGSVLVDGGNGYDSIIVLANPETILTLEGDDHVALVTQDSSSWHPKVKAWFASRPLEVEGVNHYELAGNQVDWHGVYVSHAHEWLAHELTSEFTVAIDLPNAMDLRVFQVV